MMPPDETPPPGEKFTLPATNRDYSAKEFFKEAVPPPQTGAEGEAAKAAAAAAAKAASDKAASDKAAAEAAEKAKAKPGSLADKLRKPKEPVKAEVPPTPEPTEEDKIEYPKDASEAGGTAFKAIKAVTKGLRDQLIAKDRELADAKTRLEALPKVIGSKTPEDIEKLEAEHKALSDRLLTLDVENHPTFRQQYVEPKTQAVAFAKSLLDAHGIKDVDLNALLSKPRAEFGKAVSEAAAKMSDFDRLEFSDAMRKAFASEQGARDAKAKAGDTLKALQAGTRNRQEAAFNEVEAKLASEVGEFMPQIELTDDLSPEDKADIEDYNTSVREVNARARKIAFEGSDEKGIAANSFKAAAYDLHVGKVMPRLLKEIDKLAMDNKALATELSALKGRNPNRGNLAAEGGGEGGEKKMEEMSHEEAAKAAFRKR